MTHGSQTFVGGMRYPGRSMGSNASWPLAVLKLEDQVLTIAVRQPFTWLSRFFPTVTVRLSGEIEAEIVRRVIPGTWGIRFFVPTLPEPIIFLCFRRTKDRVAELLRSNGVRIRPGVHRVL
jgi:hypothetical protein